MTDEAGPRTEAGKRLMWELDATEREHYADAIKRIEAEAAIPDSPLRAALERIAQPDHRTPGSECLWCMDDLGAHEAWCAATLARAALSPEGRQEPPT